MMVQLISLVLCITRITVGQRNFRSTHPFSTQRFPTNHNSQRPQPGHYNYHTSEVQELPGGGTRYTRTFHYSGGQLNEHPNFLASDPFFRSITNNDHFNDGTQENPLVPRLPYTMDIYNRFQSSPDKIWNKQSPNTLRNRQPETNLFENDYTSLFGQFPAQHQNLVWWGQDIPGNFGKVPKSRPSKFPNFRTLTSKMVPKEIIPRSLKNFNNPPSNKKRAPLGGQNSKSFNFHMFPSSEEVTNDSGKTLDAADSAERSEDTRRTSSSRPPKNFQEAALKLHNLYRKKHNASSLSFNSQAAKVAQEWANNLAARSTLEHRQNNRYGENLWMGGGFGYNDEEAVEHAVKDWYNEVDLYHYRGREPSMDNFMSWGHFTQLVWKGTREVGMGVARKNGFIVVVANYYPRGNCVGAFAANVN